VELLADRIDSGHYLRLNSNIMTAKLQGKYRLTDLGSIFQQAIHPYFAIAPASSMAASSSYDFTLDAYILDNPALKVLVPILIRSIQCHFKVIFWIKGWTASLCSGGGYGCE
jgi:hypothetical protein